jgi:murein DD-endopeptidase MepM/ murein hydrolase activator NlpD
MLPPFIGQTFEINNIPETHPNCQCSCDVIDNNGDYTGDSRKPNPGKPKPKPKCSRISSPKQNNRFHPHDKKNKPHYGTDFRTPIGTPIVSPVDGVVSDNDNNGRGNGNRVSVYDPKTGIEHHFLHMDSFPP